MTQSTITRRQTVMAGMTIAGAAVALTSKKETHRALLHATTPGSSIVRLASGTRIADTRLRSFPFSALVMSEDLSKNATP